MIKIWVFTCSCALMEKPPLCINKEVPTDTCFPIPKTNNYTHVVYMAIAHTAHIGI